MNKKDIDKFFNSLTNEELKEIWAKYSKETKRKNAVSIEYVKNFLKNL